MPTPTANPIDVYVCPNCGGKMELEVLVAFMPPPSQLPCSCGGMMKLMDGIAS